VFDKKYSYLGAHLQGSEIRRLFATSMRPNVISLAGGLPHADSFPNDEMAGAVSGLLTREKEIYLQYGGSRGNRDGFEAARCRMQKRGIDVPAEEIIITSGSQQVIDLMTKVFVDEGDTILMEDPTFVGALGVFRNYKARLEGIPMQEDGIDLDALEGRLGAGIKVKFMYLIPNFQNPTGLTTSIEKRMRILDLARQYDFLILEDDPYGELWFTGGPDDVRPIKAWDTEGRVVYTSSFSKIISPGIRIAWAAAPSGVIDRFDMARQMMDVCSNPLMQGVANELCSSGFLDAHIERLRGVYARQAETMLAALEKHMPDGVTWTKPDGGFYVWLTLPEGTDTLDMLKNALDADVAYVIGSAFSPDSGSRNALRLSFCHESESAIAEGIQRLAAVVRKRLISSE